jgi:hypothetical protein
MSEEVGEIDGVSSLGVHPSCVVKVYLWVTPTLSR